MWAETIEYKLYNQTVYMTEPEVEKYWAEYYPKIYGYFFRRLNTREEVEDLTSIVIGAFLKALDDPSKQIQNVNAYLWRLAHNQLVNYINNKSKSFIPVDLENFTADFGEQEKAMEELRSQHYQTRVDELIKCVEGSLKQEDLKIVQELIMNDRKSTELVEELNLKSDNIRQKLSRSLKKLREKCTELWYSEATA
ncbi:MAG: hypothetical protein OHK0017_04110 [Patescibacteria group bacterium]